MLQTTFQVPNLRSHFTLLDPYLFIIKCHGGGGAVMDHSSFRPRIIFEEEKKTPHMEKCFLP